MLGSRRTLVVDAVVAGVLFALLARVTVASGEPPAWAWLAALHVPLVVRRIWPVAVFWTVTAVAFTAVNLDVTGPVLLVVPTLAGYTLARHGPRRALWPVAVPVAAFVLGWWGNGGPVWDALALTAVFAFAVLLGAYLAELVDRTDRLEREREQRHRLATAAERARIAREMHDIVAHNVAVMVALADGAAAVTPREPQRAADMMRQSAMTGRQALTEVRRLVGLLRTSEEPGQLTPPPGLADLDELVDQVQAAGLAVTLTRTGDLDGLGPGAELAIYRIVQEALTNTLKHAGPGATAAVDLRRDPTGTDVTITDNGKGSLPTTGHGHGLAGMTERALPYGGTVTAGPALNGGWRVHAHLAPDGSPAV